MNRRWVGLGLLIVAVIVVGAPRLLAPTQVAGAVGMAPPPEPPQVGDCVLVGDTVIVVSCDQRHYAEVTARWLADDPERKTAGTEDRCQTEAATYANLPPAPVPDWHLQTNISAQLMDAPLSLRIGNRGWTICAVRAGHTTVYQGSLRDITATNRPVAAGSCGVATATGLIDVSCDQAHTDEQLAYLYRRIPLELADPGSSQPTDGTGVLPDKLVAAIGGECAAIAAALVGSSDPTRGGLLRITPGRPGFTVDYFDPTLADVSGGCSIGSADDRRLKDTVIGLGDAPVPFV